MARLQTLKPKLQTLKPQLKSAPANIDSWRAGKTTAERGYGSKWQKAREGFLLKHPFCAYCLRDAGVVATEKQAIIAECMTKGIWPTPATVVDHKIPHRGDMALFWNTSNWQSLCKDHHDGEKAREEGRGNNGR